MRKQFLIFILAGLATVAAPASVKKVSSKPAAKIPQLQNNKHWILTRNLTLQKAGLTRDEFVPFTSFWDLKKQNFVKSSSSTDHCEFRTTVSKTVLRAPSVTIKKGALFKITNVQDTTMSILVDITSREAKKTGVDLIQITCSSYDQGLDSPGQVEKFKAGIQASLAALFVSKN